jgi:molybdopterin molybdotransferase
LERVIIVRTMDRIERYRGEVLACIEPLGAERVPTAAAAGRFLAEEARAGRAAPPDTCSAMDGFAVRAADAGGPTPLRVVRAIYAGEAPGEPIAPGEAARIYTGAPLPPGADAVVREEAARESSGAVTMRTSVRAGENVRLAGEDVAVGGVALPAGVRLGARQLALLRAVGVEEVSAVRRPRVMVLSTGDEIRSGRTPDSNGTALAALARSIGAEVIAETVEDDLARIAAEVERGLARCDAVVTVGGVSVGARDLVPEALKRLGGDVRVHGVPMKPGKPFLFALARGRPLFGLPGSPSACLVAFEVFTRPALLRLAGAARPFRRALSLPLGEPVSGRAGRARFLWARVDERGRAVPVGRDAAQVRGPALADALIALKSGTAELAPGDLVEAWLLEEP